MSVDLETIRSRNPIETIVGERFPLRKSGSRFVGVEHDSLVVVPNTGFYFWNSKGEHGDIFDFVGRHVLNLGTWNNRDSAQFTEALRYLAQRAGVTLNANPAFKKSAAYGERQLVERPHEALMSHKPALAYVTKTRGWDMTTIRSARLGFMPHDKRALLADLNLSDISVWSHMGYPADLNSGQRPTWQGNFRIDGTDADAQAILHQADVFVGQSGGPMFGFWEGDVGPRAVAVQSWQTGSNNGASGSMDMRDLVALARTDFA